MILAGFRHALAIGHQDLRLFLRDRASYVWLFLVPLVFVYFMGFANRGPGAPGNPRPMVMVDNRDTGFLGQSFLDELGQQGLQVIAPDSGSGAERGIRLGTNFTAEVLAGRQSRVEFLHVQGSSEAAAALVQFRIVRALVALNSHLLEQAAVSGGKPPTAEALTALRAAPDPVVLDARFAGRKPIPTGFNLSLPGVMVMYLLMNLLTFGGSSLAGARRSGVLRRILLHPVSRPALIGGKVYGLVLLAAVQSAWFLFAGRFLFGVNLGDHLLGILLTLLIYGWVAASLGVLLGSIIRSEDKVVGLCVLVSLVMAALGGCWWPLEVVPESVRALAHCLPTGWAMDAFHQWITFGTGWSGARTALGVLCLFGVAANAAAARWFRV